MNNTDFAYNQPIQSMYMATLDNQKIKRPQSAVRDNMRVDDISGARPKFIEKPLKPRQTFNIRNDDIAKSCPKTLIPTNVNKPQFNMKVDDIDGTRSKMNKFTTTRSTNPLNPVYQIPKVQYYPVEQPKFIRDNLVTYDIEGTSTKESFAMKIQKEGKVINSKQEVLNSIELKKKSYLRKSQNKLLDVTDISAKKPKIKGNRSTNPLDPEYEIPKGQEKGSYRYGQIQKSKPQMLKAKITSPYPSLRTNDIEGAKTRVNNFVMPPKEDIKKAKVDSFKRGISSNRKTNPLNPNYQYPGWSQMNNKTSFTTSQRPMTAHQRFDAFISK